MAGRARRSDTTVLRSHEGRKQLGDLVRINSLRIKPCVGLLWVEGAVDLPRNTQTHSLVVELCLLDVPKSRATDLIADWNRDVCLPAQERSKWRSVVDCVYRSKARLRGYGCKSGAVAHSTLCVSREWCDWRGRAKGPANVDRDWERYEDSLWESQPERRLSRHGLRALRGIVQNGRRHGILPEAQHFITYRQISEAGGLGVRFVRLALHELKDAGILRRLRVPKPLPAPAWAAARTRLAEGGRSRHATSLQLRVPPPECGHDKPVLNKCKETVAQTICTPAGNCQGEQILTPQTLVHLPTTLISSPSDNGGRDD